MQEKELKMTIKEHQRLELIKKVMNREIQLTEAAELMGVSYRQAKKIKKRYKEEDVKGMIRKKGSGRKGFSESFKQKIFCIYNEHYNDEWHPFNIRHFWEKLNENHDIHISYETTRNIINKDQGNKLRKYKKKHRKERPRMPEKGLLLQMDTSIHQWLKNIPQAVPLITIVDDCSSKLLYARFFDSDSAFNNMKAIKYVIEHYGWFKALYHDRASHFTTTRKGGRWYNVAIEQALTNIEEVLHELGIISINASSPQAKGRIERSFRTHQDRLISEMLLHNITSYEKANTFLEDYFIDYYNKRFTVNHDKPSAFYEYEMENIDLDMVFTKRIFRKVKKDNTISFFHNTIQIPNQRALSLIRATVEVRWNQNNDMWILYKDRVVYNSKLPVKFIKTQKLIDEIFSKRTLYIT